METENREKGWKQDRKTMEVIMLYLMTFIVTMTLSVKIRIQIVKLFH